MTPRNHSLALFFLSTAPLWVSGYTTSSSSSSSSSSKVNWPDYKLKFKKVVEEQQPPTKWGQKAIEETSKSYREYLLSIPHDDPHSVASSPSESSTWNAYKDMIKEQSTSVTSNVPIVRDVPKHLQDHAVFESPPKSSLHHPPKFEYSNWKDYKQKLDTKSTSAHHPHPLTIPVVTFHPNIKPLFKTSNWDKYSQIINSSLAKQKKASSSWNVYKDQIGRVAKEQHEKHSHDYDVVEESASTMQSHHGPAKVEATDWDAYSHKYHLGDIEELRKIVQSTITEEQKEEQEKKSFVQHVQEEAEALLRDIKETAKKHTGGFNHFSDIGGFNH